MTLAFADPVTGELLSATPDSLEQASERARDEVGRIYRALRPIQEALADLHGETKVPSRRNRTDVQEKAWRCPRCGHWYTEVT